MQKTETAQRDFDVVVVGGGSAGIGVTASLLRRRPGLRIAVIEPSDNHYYQPAWTLVGGGAFDVAKTVRPTQAVMPARGCAPPWPASSPNPTPCAWPMAAPSAIAS